MSVGTTGHNSVDSSLGGTLTAVGLDSGGFSGFSGPRSSGRSCKVRAQSLCCLPLSGSRVGCLSTEVTASGIAGISTLVGPAFLLLQLSSAPGGV